MVVVGPEFVSRTGRGAFLPLGESRNCRSSPSHRSAWTVTTVASSPAAMIVTPVQCDTSTTPVIILHRITTVQSWRLHSINLMIP